MDRHASRRTDERGWRTPSARAPRVFTRLGAVLADLVLPLECAGCRRPGVAWCRRCEAALANLAFEPPERGWRAARGRPGRAHRVAVRPTPRGFPPMYAWGVYADPLRAAVPAWKDAGRRDLTRVLAPLLADAVDSAVLEAGWSDGAVLVVPAPSSPASLRARGDAPLEALAAAAVAVVAVRPGAGPGPWLRLAPALRHVRRVRDQAGLQTAERRRNLAHAMAVRAAWVAVVRGRRCVLVDDVVTTGATLAEAARALGAAGAAGVVAAAVAATPRANR